MSDTNIDAIMRGATAVNLLAASCVTVILYDHALTLDQEISKMWPSRFSLAKALFLANRYIVETMVIFNCISAARTYLPVGVCVFYIRWLSVTCMVSTGVVQGILLLRVWALHRHNKAALYTGFIFYISGMLSLLALVIEDYVGEQVLIDTDLDSLPGCYASSVPPMIAGLWIVPLVTETVLFVLVIHRAYIWWKDGVTMPRIFSVLARDSSLYFFIVFALLLANLLIYEFGPPTLATLFVTPSVTAGSILGSHMLLNMRAAVDGDEPEEEFIMAKPDTLGNAKFSNRQSGRTTGPDTKWNRNIGLPKATGENLSTLSEDPVPVKSGPGWDTWR